MSQIITDITKADIEKLSNEFSQRYDEQISLKAVNLRAQNEYRIVTDGEQLFRLPPNFKIPKGLTEILKYKGSNVYQRNGKLKNKFMALQRIRPANNMTRLSRSIKYALFTWT